MNAKEMREKTKEELGGLLEESRVKLAVFRFGSGFGKTKNVHVGRDLRKEIARLMTVLRGK